LATEAIVLCRRDLRIIPQPWLCGAGYLVREGQGVRAASGPDLVARGIPPRQDRGRDAAPESPWTSGHRRTVVREYRSEEDLLSWAGARKSLFISADAMKCSSQRKNHAKPRRTQRTTNELCAFAAWREIELLGRSRKRKSSSQAGTKNDRTCLDLFSWAGRRGLVLLCV